jgi:hypothetical protein
VLPTRETTNFKRINNAIKKDLISSKDGRASIDDRNDVSTSPSLFLGDIYR